VLLTARGLATVAVLQFRNQTDTIGIAVGHAPTKNYPRVQPIPDDSLQHAPATRPWTVLRLGVGPVAALDEAWSEASRVQMPDDIS